MFVIASSHRAINIRFWLRISLKSVAKWFIICYWNKIQTFEMKFQTFLCDPTFFSQLALAEGNLNIRHGSLLLHKNSAIFWFFCSFLCIFSIKSVTLWLTRRVSLAVERLTGVSCVEFCDAVSPFNPIVLMVTCCWLINLIPVTISRLETFSVFFVSIFTSTNLHKNFCFSIWLSLIFSCCCRFSFPVWN